MSLKNTNPVEKYFLSRIFDHLGGDLTTYMVLREANLTKRNFDTDHKGALEDFFLSTTMQYNNVESVQV